VRSVTLDSNIYISALHFGGKPMELLQAGIDGEIHIAISEPIIEETLRVLREKFSWSADDLRDGQAVMRAAGHLVTPTIKLSVVPDDSDDDKIVECAVESGSEAIITHDKDLLRMKEYNGIRMLKVREFIREGPERGR
jgi:putative PIN family toxin of toxin-antitoxin system